MLELELSTSRLGSLEKINAIRVSISHRFHCYHGFRLGHLVRFVLEDVDEAASTHACAKYIETRLKHR
jgi:hypothetical protein